MTGLYYDPQGEKIFSTSVPSEHGTKLRTKSNPNISAGDSSLPSANNTIETLKKRIAELESIVATPYILVGV